MSVHHKDEHPVQEGASKIQTNMPPIDDMSAKSMDARVQHAVHVYVIENLGILLKDPPTLGPALATKHELDPASGPYVALPSPDTGVGMV